MDKNISINWTNPPGDPARKNPSDIYSMVQKFIYKITRKSKVEKVNIAIEEHKNPAGKTNTFTANIKVLLDKGRNIFAKSSERKVGKAIHDAIKKIEHEEDKIIDTLKTKLKKV